MTFKDYIKDKRILIKDRLTSYLKEKKSENLPQIFKEQQLLEELESFALRGKLVRGSLFLLSSELLGKKISQELVDIAVGIELMHSSLLVQDDVIDRDYQRRGEKTIFAKFEEQGKALSANDPYHYGVSSAFIVADMAFLFAIDLIANYKDQEISQLLKYYSHEIYLVVLSESADSLFGQTKREPEKDEIFDVYKYKTARYTFALPFEMAAIASNADIKIRSGLGKFGELIGIIYQLKDDELGIFGNEDEIGKPVGSDIRENKKTFIRFLLYQKADKEDKVMLDEIFGNTEYLAENTKTIQNLYIKYGIEELINREIDELLIASKKILDNLDISADFKILLASLLEFNLSRTS